MFTGVMWKTPVRGERGVICGADSNQEWLLPWWWERYRECNDSPVTFIDFGMTGEAQKWCLERGDLIMLNADASFVASRDEVQKELAQQWEESYGQAVWNSRMTWFKKPFAFLHSPYQKTIWIDLDCEVLKSLEPLFSMCNAQSQIALVRDYKSDCLPKGDPGVLYNGGVIVFEHGSPLIETWAQRAIDSNALFLADDMLLSHIISEAQIDVCELPEKYNWRLPRGINIDAAIVHWMGPGGKLNLQCFGGFKSILGGLPRRDL